MNARKLAIALLVATACSKPAAPPAAPAASAKTAAPQLDEVLAVSNGAAVVSRTGELQLTNSAFRAIDGDDATSWSTPPGDPQQVAIYSLGGRARIERGAFVTPPVTAAAHAVRVEFSTDGEHFGNPVTLRGAQTSNISPVEASFVRISLLDETPVVVLTDLHLFGRFVDTPHAGPIDGCWSINGQPASFAAKQNDVSGYVGGEDNTTLEGGSDGHFYRFAWIRGPEYGLAAITTTPDGKHISGFVWHEEAVQMEQFFARDWLGDKASCAPAKPHDSVLEAYLRRFGYFPLFGLSFAHDGTLDAAASAPLLDKLTQLLALNPELRVRFVAHELKHPTANENVAVTKREVETLRSALAERKFDATRADFVAAGQEHPHRDPTSTVTRAMYSSVDLEIRR